MTRIKTEEQYRSILKRVDELLDLVEETTPLSDPNMIELDILSDLVEEYEDKHYPIETPSLIDVIKLRMFEMNLTQVGLAELIGVSASRVSEYLNGKAEPTLQVARELHKKLNISPNIILS